MKLKFKGIYETKRSGCPTCGTTRGGRIYKRRQTFHLPSENVITFSVGMEETISNEDGEFLLKEFDCFERVE